MAKETRKSKEKVGKKALEERIKTLEDKINSPQTASNDSVEIEVLKERMENYKDISDRAISAYKESYDKTINTYRNLGIIIISLLTFIGGSSIYLVLNVAEKTAKNTATIAAKTELKKLINIEDVLKQAETESKVVIRSLNEKVENEAGTIENDYAASLADLKSKRIDVSKPLPKETTEKLEQFKQKVAQVKTEDDYSFDDWFYKGFSEYEKKEYDNAIASWTKALGKEPEDVFAYEIRGYAYYLLKQYDKAIEDFNKAIELDPEDVFAYEIRGHAYYFLNQYDKSIEDLIKAIELDPEDVFAYDNRGHAYYLLNQYGKAIEDFNKAIELDPEDVFAYENRGHAYYLLKQFDKAIEDYNKAIELDPENISAIKNISELKTIKGNYESALGNIQNGLSLQLEIGDKAIILYLECIAKKLLNMDISICEKEFNEILKKDFNIIWGFELFDSWVEYTDINDDKKRYIKEKTELLKQKQ